MDRRQFFRLGLRNLKDTASKNVPKVIRPVDGITRIDVSILTSDPGAADRLAQEMLREHFGEKMLRLRESRLSGSFPGGILLFENEEPIHYQDGISLFSAALRTLKQELGLAGFHSDPHLLRYTNHTPAMSRSIALRHRHTLVATIPLAENRSYIFTGSVGPVRVAVADGHFLFERSLCRHQTCLAHPPIIAPGQRITCVPNELSAIVAGEAG